MNTYIICQPNIPEGTLTPHELGPFEHERAVELCKLYNEQELQDRQNVFLRDIDKRRLQDYTVANHRVNTTPHASHEWRNWLHCMTLIPHGIERWETALIKSSLNYVVKTNHTHITRVQPIKIVHVTGLSLTMDEKVTIMHALPYPPYTIRTWIISPARNTAIENE